MAKIYVILGKSSTGKDTVYRKIVEKTNVRTIRLYTTRPMREGEENGREYFFISEGELSEYERQNLIIEMRSYNTVHGIWKYVTVNDGQIDRESNEKYLVIGTLEAYKKYISYYGRSQVVPIYIEVDEKTRIHRALQREDSQKNPGYKEMCRRFLADEDDFSDEKLAEAGITGRYENYDIDICVDTIIKDML